MQNGNTDLAERHPLWVLQELSNRDKHRILNFVGMLAKVPFIEPHPGFDDGNLRIRQDHRGPLADDTELCRVWHPNAGTVEPQIVMKLGLAFDIAFDQGAAAGHVVKRSAVFPTLDRVRRRVAATINGFAGEFV